MKKLFAILAAVGFVLTAAAADATVVGTPHEFGAAGSVNTTWGICEVCHIPHAAQYGKRIWNQTISVTVDDANWTNSLVGALCGTCHNGGALGGIQNTYAASASNQNTLAYNDTTSHGRAWTDLTSAPAEAAPYGGVGDTANGSLNKPYTGAGGGIGGTSNIQCSSCHDPHNATVRPFLRPTPVAGRSGVSGFCADCHDNRWQTTTLPVATANVMHPAYIAYTYDGVGGALTFRATPDAGMTTAVGQLNGNSPWSLGGKFEGALTTTSVSSSSIVGCGTCHAVHNPAATTQAGDQGLHLLAVDNTGNTAALCEGCHGGGGVLVWGETPTNRVGTTMGDHPINVIPDGVGGPVIDKWYAIAGDTTRVERRSAATDDWPRGGGSYIICTSCHSAHNVAGDASTSGRLTRGSAHYGVVSGPTTFCFACHADPSPLGHHSHNGNTGSSIYTWSPASATDSSSLDCINCHSTGPSNAHNGFSFQFGDANQYSNLCATCHLGIGLPNLGAWATYAQSINMTTDPAIVGSVPNMHTEGGGTGAFSSHFLGTFTDGSNSINVKRSSWDANPLYPSFSKYGSAGSRGLTTDGGNLIICESCHSVLYNIGARAGANAYSGYAANLLLQAYEDDSDADGQSVDSNFCLACHNQTNAANAAGPLTGTAALQDRSIAPLGMHPMTAWSITKAQDIGRSPITLITSPSGETYADAFISAAGARKATGNGYVSYPAGNEMDCDSCHRPHRANANTSWTKTKAAPGSARPVIIEDGTADDFAALCLECHAY